MTHVAPHRARFDTQALGKFGHRPDAAGLKELQQCEHLSCWSCHGLDFISKYWTSSVQYLF